MVHQFGGRGAPLRVDLQHLAEQVNEFRVFVELAYAQFRVGILQQPFGALAESVPDFLMDAIGRSLLSGQQTRLYFRDTVHTDDTAAIPHVDRKADDELEQHDTQGPDVEHVGAFAEYLHGCWVGGILEVV